MRWTIGSVRILALLALLLVQTSLAYGQERATEDRTITVLQPKPILRAYSLELRPRFSSSIANPLVQTWGIGGSIAFSPGERWFLAFSGDLYDFGTALGGPTDRYRESIRTTATIPEIVQPRWAAGIEGAWVPLFGKFAFFNRTITYLDFYLLGGIGAHGATDDLSPTFTIGTGTNIYLLPWLSLFFEVRDRISFESLADDSRMYHSVSASTGLGFVVPMASRQTRTGGASR